MRKLLRVALFILVCCDFVHLNAQVGIGTTVPKAALDVFSLNDGLLIPRIALTNTTTATILTPTESEMVYNTNTSGDVTPGYYYWTGTKWTRLAAGVSTDWNLTGNSGTSSTTNFIGTTDNIDFNVRTNNSPRFTFSNNGRFRSTDNGTIGQPTFSWNGDEDTGIYRPTANGLGLVTAGTERIRILPSGSIGMGIATPKAALDITSSDEGLLIPRIALTNTTTATVLTPTESEMVYNTNTAGDVTPGYYYWDGGKWNRLEAGVKTDWSLLGNTGTNASTNYIGTADAIDLRFRTGGINRWNISNTNSGQLQSYSLGTATLPAYSFQANTGNGIFSPVANNLAIATTGVERVRVEADGDVGIGITPNASAKLQISATDRGILIPNIALTATNVTAPITAPATSLLIYNTNTTAGINGVSPGFYYYNGGWVKMAVGTNTDWSLNGNSGTTATNYIGTSDAIPLRISTSGAEKMRVLANGQVIVNSTTAFTGDRFSVFDNVGGSDSAINGYSTNAGVGTYGENVGSGIGLLGINVGTGAGVLGTTTGDLSAGVFARADVDAGSAVYATTNGIAASAVFGNATGDSADGVYSQSTGTNGTGVRGFANNTNGDGVIGGATAAGRFGIYGYNNNNTGTGVFGSSTGNNSRGVSGSSTGNNGIAVFATVTKPNALAFSGSNSDVAGTGISVSGNGLGGVTIPGGSGAIFRGASYGSLAFSTTTGVAGVGNGSLTVSSLTGGSGGAFTGTQWGVTGFANSIVDTQDRAVLAGTYNTSGAISQFVYVGARIGGVNYKILGQGGASVSTTMKTTQGERILFAPESPENWFFDLGEVELVNGRAKVKMDPIFAECISDLKPFKVFIQGAENTLGAIKITRNQQDKSFEVEDLGGASNGTVQYNIYAIWKGKENLRFPEFKPQNVVQNDKAIIVNQEVSIPKNKKIVEIESPRKQKTVVNKLPKTK